eukprot:GFUD01070566.1.p1 GENE.GFUD01070566.1~~GFUD01070566.1.p1  ORF type:complete len:173 (-),score=51.69 GFUD01070566.1:214-732(-)
MSTELLNRLDSSRTDRKVKDQMDGLDTMSKMDTVYPTALSRHSSDCSSQKYKRTVKKKVDRRGRFRTQPITFMGIKEVDEEMTEDNLKVATSEDKSRSDLSLKKTTQLSRSQSCRKSNPGSRKKTNQRNDPEDAVIPGDEDEMLDIVDDYLQNGSISLRYHKGFSTKPLPSI